MGRAKRGWIRLFALTLMAALPFAAMAQSNMPGTIPGMGSMTSASSQPIQYGGAPGQMPDPPPDYESSVSFIDSALPMSQVKMIIDCNYDFRRPTRAEYLLPKSGVPGSPGWWTPERRVDYQELRCYIEIAY